MGLLKQREDLRGYQRYFAEKIIRLPGVLLAVKMSLGKTGAVLYATRTLLDLGEVNRVLVVGPKRVAALTWPEELNDWDFTRPISRAVITGAGPQRLKQLHKSIKDGVEITTINRENIPWLVETLGAKWPYDMLIYDESSRMKSGKKRTALRRKSEFGALCSIRKYLKKVVEMSGTPSPNGVIDLWGQIYLLDGGERLGTKRTEFYSRWFEPDHSGYKLLPRPGAQEQIMSRVKDVMFSLRAKDYLSLPPVISSKVEVVLPSKVMKEYNLFKRELVSEKYDVEAVSRGVLVNKLLQFSNGSMYRFDDDGDRQVVHVHDEKLAALDSILRECDDENVLVAYSYAFDKKMIKKKFPHAVIFNDDPKAYEKWNKGKIKLLLAHPANIGHGLNMQFGGHRLVWYGMPWSLELYEQMNARLPRPGQPSANVFIQHIISAGTYDVEQYNRLNTKGVTQEEINRAVEIHLRKVDKKSLRR